MRKLNLQEQHRVVGGTDADVDHVATAVAGVATVAAATGLEPVAAVLYVGAGLIELGGAIGDLF